MLPSRSLVTEFHSLQRLDDLQTSVKKMLNHKAATTKEAALSVETATPVDTPIPRKDDQCSQFGGVVGDMCARALFDIASSIRFMAQVTAAVYKVDRRSGVEA